MLLSPAAMVAISIFAITYICIATEKVDKTAAALLGAAIVVSLGVVPYEAALHAVDLNVVLLLVGMMVAVNVMAGTGVFEWVAVTILGKPADGVCPSSCSRSLPPPSCLPCSTTSPR